MGMKIIGAVILVILIIGVIYVFSTSTPQTQLSGFQNSFEDRINLDFCISVDQCEQGFRSNGVTEAQIESLDIQCEQEVCTALGETGNVG